MKQPDFFYDGSILPFLADLFDMVMSTQVLAMTLSKILPDKGQLYLNIVVCARKL